MSNEHRRRIRHERTLFGSGRDPFRDPATCHSHQYRRDCAPIGSAGPLSGCVIAPPIPEDQRLQESTLLREFERARPRILGALLDAISSALKNHAMVVVPSLPRMADFAVWVTAAEPGLGWPAGTFLSAYRDNLSSANELALEASPITTTLLKLLSQQGGWKGTSAELLQVLESMASPAVQRNESWPKNARSLSGQIRRLAPNLRKAGWEIRSIRRSHHRILEFVPWMPVRGREGPAGRV